MSDIIEMVTSFPKGIVKNQCLGLLLVWHKDVFNFKLEEIKEMIEKVKSRKLQINYKPMQIYIDLSLKYDFWRAKEELMVDMTPKMIRELMGGMFEKPSEDENLKLSIEKKVERKSIDFEKEAVELIEIKDGDTLLQVLAKLYGSEGSAKTFCTKNKLNPSDKDWKKGLEIIAKSTSKYKGKAKILLEGGKNE